MASSKKYLGINIRRPTSAIESNTESTCNSMSLLMPKRILSMHAANQINSQNGNQNQYSTQNQHHPKTYLPMKCSMLVTPSVRTNKHSTASLNSSLNANSSQIDLNHQKQQKHIPQNIDKSKQVNLRCQKQQQIETNEVDESNSSDDEEICVNEAKKQEHEMTISNKTKSKHEIISIPTKRLVNPTNDISTTRLRQSFFMNEFPGQSFKQNHISISNATNIQPTFERYEPEQRPAEEKFTSNKKTTNYSNQPRYGTNYIMKYAMANSTSTLPSKTDIIESEKNKSAVKNTDSSNSSNKQIMFKNGSSLNRSMTEKNKSSTNQLSSIGNVSKSTSVKSGSYKNFLLNHQRSTAAAMVAANTNITKQVTNTESSINGSTQNCSQAAQNATNANNKYMTLTKSMNSSRNSYPTALSTTSVIEPTPVLQSSQKREHNEDPEIEKTYRVEDSNSVLVDQMASFIDELKDFIDDRLIDTTSQLEMANQRISGLYYNLNYLTREFVELKIQNEELKNELQLSNNISKNNSPVSSMSSHLAPPSYYQKLNESRRKNRACSSFTKKSDPCDQIVITSSSKTSSIETASSSTSESLAISQSALASASQESQCVKNNRSEKPLEDHKIRNISRNEMMLIMKNQEINEVNEKYRKMASSSSSVGSVDYDNISIVNKLEGINWTDSNSIDQNQYLRSSSQIELNNIDDRKYGSMEFEDNDCNLDNEENEEDGDNVNDDEDLEENEILTENETIEDRTTKMLQIRHRQRIEIEALNFENKFNKLKETDLRNSLKQSPHLLREVISNQHHQASSGGTNNVNPNKIVHHLHASIIPYSNFRDFDTQYSWDYTDNLVNKFASKLSTGLKN